MHIHILILSFFSGIPEELILPDLSVFRQNMMHSNESALHELQDQNCDIMTTNDSVMTSHDSIGPIGEFWKHSTSYLLNNVGFTHTQTHTHSLSLALSLSISLSLSLSLSLHLSVWLFVFIFVLIIKHAVLGTHLSFLDCLSRTVS